MNNKDKTSSVLTLQKINTMFETRNPIEERPGYHFISLMVFVVAVGIALYSIMFVLALIFGKQI